MKFFSKMLLGISTTILLATPVFALDPVEVADALEIRFAGQSACESKKSRRSRGRAIELRRTPENEAILNPILAEIARRVQKIPALGREEGSLPQLSLPELREKFYCAADFVRFQAGKSPLDRAPILEPLAQNFAKYLAQTDDFAHTTRDGIDFTTRLKFAEIPYETAGENLAKNFSDLPPLFAARRQSTGHRANLLRDEFSQQAVGQHSGYRVHLFLQPRD